MKIQNISELSKGIDVPAVRPRKSIFAVMIIAVAVLTIVALKGGSSSDRAAHRIDHAKWLAFYEKHYVGFLKKNGIDESAAFDTQHEICMVDYDDGKYRCMLTFSKPPTDIASFGITLNSSLYRDRCRPLTVPFNDKYYNYEVNGYLLGGGRIGYYVGLDEYLPGQSYSEHHMAFLIDGDGTYQYRNEDIPELTDAEMRIINELLPDIKNLTKIIADKLVV